MWCLHSPGTVKDIMKRPVIKATHHIKYSIKRSSSSGQPSSPIWRGMREETQNKEMEPIPLRKVRRTSISTAVFWIQSCPFMSVFCVFQSRRSLECPSRVLCRLLSNLRFPAPSTSCPCCCASDSAAATCPCWRRSLPHTHYTHSMPSWSVLTCIFWSDAGSVGAAGRRDCSVTGRAALRSVFVRILWLGPQSHSFPQRQPLPRWVFWGEPTEHQGEIFHPPSLVSNEYFLK